MPARARWSRQRSIRALLTLSLVVPLACLLALWGFGTDVTVTRAGDDHAFAAADRLYSGPAQALGSALAVEQMQEAEWLGGGRHAPLAPLVAQFRVTDRAAASFLAAARADQAVIPSSAEPALHVVESLLAGRAALRADAEAGQLGALAAVRAYGAILTALDSFDASLLVAGDAALSRQAAATVAANEGANLAYSEVALADSAVAAGGAMSTPERVLFVQDAAGARLMISDALTALNPSLGAAYRQVRASDAYRAFATVEDQIAASAGNARLVPVDAPAIAASAGPLTTDYQTAQQQDAVGLASLAAQASGTATLGVVLMLGLGLVAVLLSIVLATQLWWRLTRDVTRLQRAALMLEETPLPRLGGQRSAADADDGTAAPAPRPAGGIREIARTSAALSAAQQLARQTIAAQDQVRSGASQLLRNLGLHSHALVHRQLRLLAVIERGTTDPQTLAGLAAVGELATRMRRQADGLIVLSGGSLARSDQAPLPIADLIRAATAEVDGGSRVTVVGDSPDAVTAEAVADVLYLIAELVDNAVRHTPQLAEVTVRTGRAGRGLVVEIEDNGSGFTEQHLERANALLADPPDIGLAVGDGLGLLVVARLAVRHQIMVSLRSSPIAGTTAILLLPHAILIPGEARDTIIDGSLPRIDALTRRPVVPPQGPGSPPLPQREAGPEAAPPTRRTGWYAPAQPTGTARAVPSADSAAPWHWLTANKPARSSPPEPAEPADAPADEGRDAGTPDGTGPDATGPDATGPDATAPPDGTGPDATAPPDGTGPDATAPPDATASDATAPDAPAPLPRRIRPGTPAPWSTARATLASDASDQPPIAASSGGDPEDPPGASVAGEPADEG